MRTVRLLNTAGEIDEGILAALQAGDRLILRDRQGRAWEWTPDHYLHAPEAGWGASVAHHGPFAVLWWPGDVLVPAGALL